ncbi:MAG TPA: hypothetical protein VFJ81_14395, partial [Gemmatimonadales bacterium]|nr:hypothetical protein [Gemmatimonadales bacterium]
MRAVRWALALGALLRAGIAAAQTPGALVGEARDAATGRPLEGARILLRPGGLAALTTGADG